MLIVQVWENGSWYGGRLDLAADDRGPAYKTGEIVNRGNTIDVI